MTLTNYGWWLNIFSFMGFEIFIFHPISNWCKESLQYMLEGPLLFLTINQKWTKLNIRLILTESLLKTWLKAVILTLTSYCSIKLNQKSLIFAISCRHLIADALTMALSWSRISKIFRGRPFSNISSLMEANSEIV